MRGRRGFTLVELVMVIVIVGIIGLISTRFITLAVSGWQAQSGRHEMAVAAAVAAEKLAREIRQALPNSVRTLSVGGNQCLELVPVLYASDYLDMPVATAGNQFQALEFTASAGGESGYVAVYPYSEKAVYGRGNTPGAAISSSIATAAAPVDHVQLITFSASEQFPTDSPQRRFFMISQPVAWCEDGAGGLWRYRNYGFAPDSRSLLPATGSNAELMINGVLPASFDVGIDAAGLQRNSVIRFSFSLLRSVASGNTSAEQLEMVREVQVENVP